MSLFKIIETFFGKGFRNVDVPDSVRSLLEVKRRSDALPSSPTTFEEAPLVATHNISEAGVKASAELGGIPSPSIGITRADDPLRRFIYDQDAPVTLVAKPEAIDPARDPRVYVYGSDAYTGRQPKGKVRIANPKQFKERLKADVNLGHMADYAAIHLNKGDPEEADNTLKVINAAIDNNLVNPKDFNNIVDLFLESSRRLGSVGRKSSFLNQYDGLSEYADVRRMLEPADPYYSSGNRRPDVPYTKGAVLKQMREGEYGPMYLQASERGSQGMPGAFRASLSEPFGSLAEVQDARQRIASELNYPREIRRKEVYEGDMDSLYNAFKIFQDDLILDLTTKYKGLSTNNAFELIQDVARGFKPEQSAAILNGTFPVNDIPKLKAALDATGEILKEMPAPYFEAKPNKFMDFSQFSHAVVGKNVDDETIKILDDAGIDVVKEDAGYGGENLKNILPNLKESLFSVPLAGTVGYGAFQTVGDDDGQGSN